MNLKGNNAEKLATTLIIFFVLLISYILISFLFAHWSTPNWPSMVKDGMGFAVTGITPVIAILLFNDWREQHELMKREANLEKILLNFNIVDRRIKKFLNSALSINADVILAENLVPLKSEFDQCSQDITNTFLQLQFFEFKTNDQELNKVCQSFLIEIVSVLTQCKFCVKHFENTTSENETNIELEQASLNASKTLLLNSVKTYWDSSQKKREQIDKLSKKYIIEST
ncbi:hypothetical protein FM020_10060 [Acinetobacter tandoii]|nr:hypothetical protein FM020_10060 [Acinetobacter tandoii]